MAQGEGKGQSLNEREPVQVGEGMGWIGSRVSKVTGLQLKHWKVQT